MTALGLGERHGAARESFRVSPLRTPRDHIYQTTTSQLQFTISDNGSGATGAEHMDVDIFQNPYYPHELLTRLHDKRRGANFDNVHIVQYCNVTSFLPTNTKQNIFTGQYHRLSRLLTCEKAFHVDIAILTFKLTEAGYNRTQLRSELRKLLRTSPYRYSHHKANFHFHKIMNYFAPAKKRGLRRIYDEANGAGR